MLTAKYFYVPPTKGGDILFLVRMPSASASASASASGSASASESTLLRFRTLSFEPMDGFDQTCTDTLLGGWNELIRFW